MCDSSIRGTGARRRCLNNEQGSIRPCDFSRSLRSLPALPGLPGLVRAQGASVRCSRCRRAVQGLTEPTAVVELFTSQGCSSCPTADAVLAQLAKRDDIIALSLPVDYWDYLGWKDTLANPKFTERQTRLRQGRAATA